ncbi:MAG: PSD1 and planctomycete cytochrome C domain-containing protein [Planctomycetota bacterium]|nr:PSD1 and planctomycete cytochrome C domain-containing protein [Planctomycetota bacterium]
MTRVLPLLFAVLVLSGSGFDDGAALRAADDELRTFEKDIWPIFRAHCFDCHGATEEIKGELDLRLVRFLKKGGESGAAIEPGKPGGSYLLDRIRNGEMPPGEKSISQHEISIVEQWILQGARTAREEPESIGPGLGVTPEERSFWSFQPVKRPDVPPVDSFPVEARVRTVVDALLAKSIDDSIGFAPDADRRTAVKRAYFHLIGLPPSPDEMQKWIDDQGGDWYDRLLTELLDTPHYGERWARHWLDIAGYADSEGYTPADTERPWAWKYRDWVIRALNADKPFDQFVIEQLAGDELAGPQNGDLTVEQIELLTATGFLRMAADGTGSGANNPDGQNQVISDTLKIVGTSLLGLSLQCAQCHDHRYDPIPQTDYYALRAVFEPALNWKAWRVPNARRVSLYTKADRERAAEIEAEAQVVAAEKSSKQAEFIQQALDQELLKFDEPLRAQLRSAYETPGDKRTDQQKQLLAKNPSVNINAGVLYQYLPKAAEELKKFDERINQVRAKKPVEEFLRALVEPSNQMPETKLFFRGDHQQPKQTVAPAALSVTALQNSQRQFASNDDALPTTGRRLAFARWLANGQHPLLARVIVNRVWLHHFGKGIVPTPSDFGRLGVPPVNLELLDLLADEFVRNQWSLKKLHRMLLSSTQWRQVRSGGNGLVRLEAETLRDRMLAVSGQLDRTPFGSPVKIKEDDTGQIIVDGPQLRRSLYVQVRRSRPVAMMQAFDAPVMQTNCESRVNSTVATQSLMLLNGEFILEQAAKLADRAANEAASLTPEQLATLPEIPPLIESSWQYGFGAFDAERNRTGSFTALGHWTGNRWQFGTELPDPVVGYCFLTATGGHPDVATRAVIRRWTAPVTGQISVTGSLQHGSPNGDGVRGRVVSSRSGMVGEWTSFNGNAGTSVRSVEVEAGDTIDFITDCREQHTSDSFNWPVTITLKATGQPDQEMVASDQFRGPDESRDVLPGQIVKAWELALCRPPEAEELQLAVTFVGQQISTFQTTKVALPDKRTASQQAIIDLCQTLLSSNEFLYID